MKKVVIAIFVIGIIFSSFLYYQQSEKVAPLADKDITDNQLLEMLKTQPKFYVYFYSPICEECQKAEPKLIEALNLSNPKVNLVKINTLDYETLFEDYKEKYNFPGVPVVLRFEEGEVTGGLAGGPDNSEIYINFFEDKGIGK